MNTTKPMRDIVLKHYVKTYIHFKGNNSKTSKALQINISTGVSYYKQCVDKGLLSIGDKLTDNERIKQFRRNQELVK